MASFKLPLLSLGKKPPVLDHRPGLMQWKAKKFLAPAKKQTSILGC
jgi:hypothetical protein